MCVVVEVGGVEGIGTLEGVSVGFVSGVDLSAFVESGFIGGVDLRKGIGLVRDDGVGVDLVVDILSQGDNFGGVVDVVEGRGIVGTDALDEGGDKADGSGAYI